MTEQTARHKHRHVVVPSWDVWYVRALRRPLWHRINQRAVDVSPYPYGVRMSRKDHHDEYTLSLLGILHRWTGLTLEVKDALRERPRE